MCHFQPPAAAEEEEEEEGGMEARPGLGASIDRSRGRAALELQIGRNARGA